MSIFSKPKIDSPPAKKKIEPVTKVEGRAGEEAQRQRRLSVLAGGRKSMMLTGILSQLKKRLGE